MGNTKIEWTEKTWNPVTGCTPISPGCRNCYAKRMAKRLAGRYGYPANEPFRVTVHEDRFNEPLRWKKPSLVFVCSMGDLFHEDVPDETIDRVWYTMALAKRHTHQVLTKRAARMRAYVCGLADGSAMRRLMESVPHYPSFHGTHLRYRKGIPMPNLWLGVTAEDQQRADERIPDLLATPAAVRFVSYEPALGPVDWHRFVRPKRVASPADCAWAHWRTDWVVCGGETGPGARPMHPDWARQARDQCQAAGVPFFFKGWGEWAPATDVDLDNEVLYLETPHSRYHELPNGRGMVRVGKKRAGRLLDGCTWNEMPGDET